MNDPDESANPLGGLLGDLLKVIGGASGGTIPWLDAARSLATGVATDGAPEFNPDPLARIKLGELARVAELHVAEATGFAVSSHDQPITFALAGRGAWALRALEAWRPFLEGMVAAQESTSSTPSDLSFDPDDMGGLQDLLGRFALTMGPVLLGMQFGSAAGHLAQRALGQYALPIPWPESGELLVVPENIAAFAEDWSLPIDQTELWMCVHELTTHVVMSRPHVHARLVELLSAATRDSVDLQQGLMKGLGTDASDPEMLQNLLADPESLLADLLTPGQQRTSAQLTALTTALGGYVDHITSTVATSLTGSSGALGEAWYRYRVTDGKGEQAAGALFGLDLGRGEVDRGAAFVRGVLERSGDAGLARLWASEHTLPTPAELDAPGLWLERISLPPESE